MEWNVRNVNRMEKDKSFFLQLFCVGPVRSVSIEFNAINIFFSLPFYLRFAFMDIGRRGDAPLHATGRTHTHTLAHMHIKSHLFSFNI